MAPVKRKYINWDAVEPLYRQGHLSNYEVAAQYAADHINSQTWQITVSEAAIRKRAKAKGWQKDWQKDLAEKVQKKIKENLVRGSVRDANQNKTFTDSEIIERATCQTSIPPWMSWAP